MIENENYFQERSKILSLSKKIRKFNEPKTLMMPLRDITNQIDSTTSSKSIVSKRKIFVEDGIKKTSNYATLSYKASKRKELRKFLCFHERDLDIPIDFAKKMKYYGCDNDCSTDEDRVQNGIKKLFKFLEERSKEEKENENESENENDQTIC